MKTVALALISTKNALASGSPGTHGIGSGQSSVKGL